MADLSTSKASEYVTLVSRDGYEYIVRRSAACVSGTIARMLDSRSKSPYNDSSLFTVVLEYLLHFLQYFLGTEGCFSSHEIERGSGLRNVYFIWWAFDFGDIVSERATRKWRGWRLEERRGAFSFPLEKKFFWMKG